MSQQQNPSCDGFGDCYGDHCCYINGSPCPYLRIDERIQHPSQGRKYSCSLMSQHKSWQKVHRDPRYRRDVAPYWEKKGKPSSYCGDFITGREAKACRDAVKAGERDPSAGCCMTRDLYKGE